MEELNGIEVRLFSDITQWESWLADHHELPGGVWLKIAKKNSGQTSITIREALDVALCYGWIDSLRKSLDDAYYLQKYSPRRPRGTWSKVNIEKAEKLMAAGRMQPPGLAEIQAAKADGRWDAAYESQKNATIPPDLATALEQNNQAREFFESLSKTNRYMVILRLSTAKNRAARLQRIIATLEAREIVK